MQFYENLQSLKSGKSFLPVFPACLFFARFLYQFLRGPAREEFIEPALDVGGSRVLFSLRYCASDVSWPFPFALSPDIMGAAVPECVLLLCFSRPLLFPGLWDLGG